MRKSAKANDTFVFSKKLEEENITNFKKILPMFYYNKKTNDRILDTLDTSKRTSQDNYLDELFKLGPDRRRFLKVRLTATIDPTFSDYKNMFRRYKQCGRWNGYRRLYSGKEYCNMLSEYKLMHYKTYKSGLITYKNQSMRLFKFISQQQLLRPSEIEKITTTRLNKDFIYFCISRNPVDYLFCSTGQSFTSCESLRSQNYGAFYMGLGGLSLDPNRCIMFITEPKTKISKLKNNIFNHFQYITRSWGILHDDDILKIIRYYPYFSINFSILLRKMGINSSHNREMTKSKFEFEFPEYRDGRIASIYLDTVGLLNSKKGRKYYSSKGITGCATHLSYDGVFDRIKSWSDLNKIKCPSCGCYRSSTNFIDLSSKNYKYSTICKDCHSKRFTVCDGCGQEEYDFNGRVHADKIFLCLTCLYKDKYRGFVCYCCGSTYSYKSKQIKIKRNEYVGFVSCYPDDAVICVCESCNSKIVKCVICNKYLSTDIHSHHRKDNKYYCANCIPYRICRVCGNYSINISPITRDQANFFRVLYSSTYMICYKCNNHFLKIKEGQ